MQVYVDGRTRIALLFFQPSTSVPKNSIRLITGTVNAKQGWKPCALSRASFLLPPYSVRTASSFFLPVVLYLPSSLPSVTPHICPLKPLKHERSPVRPWQLDYIRSNLHFVKLTNGNCYSLPLSLGSYLSPKVYFCPSFQYLDNI